VGLISGLPTSMKNPITALRPAAQYLRMSTELQKYSLANQSAAIAEYARVEGFEIVRSFEDAGISGVTTKKRVGLATMLSEVVAGSADFEAILVLDVSRWGRYQDADESAHYEFMCRQAGVPIHYCGERFRNDFTSPIMKQIKRVMAGEYSRDLSVKVRRGKRRMAEGGYAQGGGCPFGLQRREFHADGSPGRLLARSQRKSNPGYTVRFEKGSTREVGVVLRIFRSYVHERLDTGLIANALNANRQMWHDGSRWRVAEYGTYLHAICWWECRAMPRPRGSWAMTPFLSRVQNGSSRRSVRR
jgi:DNA invertase Pin-like site-specific DNA recombinase